MYTHVHHTPMGVPHASLKLPPVCTVKVYTVYVPTRVSRSRVLPKHISVYGLFKGVNCS